MGPDVERLVEEAAAGSDEAWGALILVLEPFLMRLARSPRWVTGKLSQDEDRCRDIMVEVIARLYDADRRRLRMYLDFRAGKPDLSFEPWIRTVAKRVAIDYIRGLDIYIDRRRSRNPDSAPDVWVDLSPLTSSSRLFGIRPAITNHTAALTMLRYAHTHLPASQRDALLAWLKGKSFDHIGEEMEIAGAVAAQKLVRAALQRLRRAFRGGAKERA